MVKDNFDNVGLNSDLTICQNLLKALSNESLIEKLSPKRNEPAILQLNKSFLHLKSELKTLPNDMNDSYQLIRYSNQYSNATHMLLQAITNLTWAVDQKDKRKIEMAKRSFEDYVEKLWKFDSYESYFDADMRTKIITVAVQLSFQANNLMEIMKFDISKI